MDKLKNISNINTNVNLKPNVNLKDKILNIIDVILKYFPIIYDFYKDNKVKLGPGEYKSISGINLKKLNDSYFDDLCVVIGFLIIMLLVIIFAFFYFINFFATINLDTDIESSWLSKAAQYFFLPIIGIILIIIANIKIWFYKYNKTYPDDADEWSKKDLKLPIIIFFFLCMTQTIISYLKAIKDNTLDNWANFYIKYFLTIIVTYFLFLLGRNNYGIVIWIFAFLPAALLFGFLIYFFTFALSGKQNNN
jgi:hypothetical protein